MKGLFVVGTDTAVGKTTVSRGLLRWSLRQEWRLAPYKPAETGVEPPAASDADRLHAAAGGRYPRAEICRYAFRLAAAPQAAAAAEGAFIDPAALLQGACRLAARSDALLVEGAGGLLVPYAPGWTAAELATLFGIPVLVVARTALGTINHTALTVQALQARRIPLAGVILVAADLQAASPDAAALISLSTGAEILGALPHLPDATDDHLADALQLSLGPAALNRLIGRDVPETATREARKAR